MASQEPPLSRPAPSAQHVDFPPFVSASGRLRIPTTLPPTPSFRPLTLDDLDPGDELRRAGASRIAILASLHRSVQQLLEIENATTALDLPQQLSNSSIVPFVRCRPPPPRTPAGVPGVPTHMLELRFSDTGERYRTPVYGILWGLQCPPLAAAGLLRSRAPLADADCILLPLISVEMPHRPAWPILHRYLYDGSVAQLLSGLLGDPAAGSACDGTITGDGPGGGGGNGGLGPEGVLEASWGTDTPAHEEQKTLDSLLVRLMRLREVWRNAARLEMADRQLWATLRRAWSVLVARLGEVAARIPGSNVPYTINSGSS